MKLILEQMNEDSGALFMSHLPRSLQSALFPYLVSSHGTAYRLLGSATGRIEFGISSRLDF